MFDIVDETSNDTIVTDKGEIPNSEWMQRSRLRYDARKWLVSKLNPKKYGDREIKVIEGGDVPIKIDFTD